MARIPTIDGPQIRQQPLGAPTVGGQGPDNSGMQRGFAQLTQAAQQFADKERAKADTAAVMEADRRLTEWQNQAMFDPENGVYSRKGANALDITNQTTQAFDQIQTKIGQDLKSERQRQRYQTIVESRRQSLTSDLNRYEYRERETYYDQVDSGQLQTSMQSAALNYNDPEKIAHFQNKGAAVLASQAARKGLPDEMAQAELLKFNSGMSSAVISRMANDNPYKAREYFNQAQGAMTAEDQVQMDRLITREIKARELEARQLQAIARVELTSRVQDAEAAYMQGLDFAKPPARQDFLQAYGAEEGAERYDQFLKVQSVGSTIRDLATADPEERMRLIDEYNPAQDGIASDGFRQDAQLYGVTVQAVTALGRELQADPAAYAAKYSPLIRTAIEALESGDPDAAQAYAAATLAEQERLGAIDPQLLTTRQADAIVRQFDNIGDGGSNSAAMVEQLQEQWGKHWPAVYKQLQGKLPGAALVIGSGVDEATAATLARIAPLKNEDLKRGLDPTELSDSRELLREELAPFRQTLAQQVGGDRTYATIDREAERLAMAYMAQGKSYKDAVAETVRALVTDKYTIKGSWRVPVQYDAGAVERGAELVLKSVDANQLHFAVPAGVDKDFAAARVKAAIDKDGYWVTLPDESGLALYYGGAAVLTQDGEAITRPWEDLIGESVNQPGAWQRFNEGRRRMQQGPAGAGSMGAPQ